MRNEKFFQECEAKLLELKMRYHLILDSKENKSDENSVVNKNRVKSLLPEIYSALSRIQNGTYGICEETGEEISPKRLKAVPWARFNIQNAS